MTTGRTKTATKTSSLHDAMRHGEAQHERSPWRIRNGRLQAGRPVLDRGGRPKEDRDGALRLIWHEITAEIARKTWSSTGWILG